MSKKKSVYGSVDKKTAKIEKDRIGGAVFKTGIVPFKVNENHLVISDKTGAIGLHYEVDLSGVTSYGTEYFISGKEKGNKTYFVDKSGNKRPLPGYELINGLTLATLGKGILDVEDDYKEKVIKGFGGKKQKVMVLPKMIGKKGFAAVYRIVVDKPKKDKKGNIEYDKKGKPKPSGEFIETLKIVKFLDPKKRSAWEIENKVKKPDFAKKFDKKWKDQKEPIDMTIGKAYTKKKKEGGKKKKKKSKKSKGF